MINAENILNGNSGSPIMSDRKSSRSRKQILHSYFDPVTTQETVDWCINLIKSGKSAYLCTVNVAIMMMMRSNPRLSKFIDNAGLIVADGQPIIWASQWLQEKLPERVTGVDLIDLIAARAAKEEIGIYLLGAQPKTIAIAVANLQSKYPTLKICGFDDGYFNSTQAAARAESIRKSSAKILFVGMGVPLQEIFLEENWSKLGVNLAIGVGGSFEIFAGTKKRAPLWMQETGLEWLYRLIQEPRRLWKRYLITNSQFLAQLLQAIAKKNSSRYL